MIVRPVVEGFVVCHDIRNALNHKVIIVGANNRFVELGKRTEAADGRL
jgi:hypothetical protein